jgi:hypothetical protein
MTENLFIQQGDPKWLSPSIWLTVGSTTHTFTAVSSPPITPGGTTGTTKNTINVQVDRMGGGTDPSPVRVDAYVCIPTSGVGPGGSTLLSAGGTSGLPGSDDPSLPFPQVLTMDWYPVNAEASSSQGHLCIGANAYDYAGDGHQIMYPSVIDLTDQHMAQRNISIVPTPPSHQPRWLSTNFVLPQADVFLQAADQTAVIKIEHVPVEKTLSPLIREQLLMSSRVALVGGAAADGTAASTGALPEPRERTLLRGGGNLMLAGTDVEIVPAQGPPPTILLQGPCGFTQEQQTVLQPRNPLPITATFQVTPDKPGEVFEFDIVHLLSSGQIFSGLRVVVVTMGEGE